MEELVNVLQGIIDKYGVSEEDFNAVQKAISDLENGANDEFTYVEAKEDVPAEAPIEVGNPEIEK